MTDANGTNTEAGGTEATANASDAETSDADPLVVYADYVCPFCYLGRATLREYRDDADDPPPVEWRPFDLRSHKRGPDGEVSDDVEDGKDEDYFQQAMENVRRLREEYDVEMTVDRSRDVDSWNAHQAALHVERSYDGETFREFHDAVFDAHWLDERDIGDPDVLADIAASVGVDPDGVREAVADESLADALRERFAAAQQRGVTGVPTFAYGGHAARGAVPPEQLRRLVEGQ